MRASGGLVSHSRSVNTFLHTLDIVSYLDQRRADFAQAVKSQSPHGKA